MLKKIYKALPKKVTQFYKKARKHIMLRFVFPMTYKRSARGKEIQDKKVVFVEIRYKKIVHISLFMTVLLPKATMFMYSTSRISHLTDGLILAAVLKCSKTFPMHIMYSSMTAAI